MRRGNRQEAKGEINNQFLITGFGITCATMVIRLRQ
jgi:hypothetical protein